MGLTKIGRPRIAVYLRIDFIDARQRVQDHGVFLHAVHHRLVDNIFSPCLFVVGDAVSEALLLNARLVDHIDLRSDGVQILFLLKVHLVALQVLLNVVFHPHQAGGDEIDLGILELGQ